MPLFKKSTSSDDQPSELDREVAEAFVAMGHRDKDAPVPAGLAKETLIAMMFRHADMLAGTMQAGESATLYELASHLAGVGTDALTKGKNPDELRELGSVLLAAGRFQLATSIFEQLVAENPSDRGSHVRLAAMYRDSKSESMAREFLETFFVKHPVTSEPAASDTATKGTVLQFSGYGKTTYKIGLGSNGIYKYYRSGGHFMLRHLVDLDHYDVDSYVIAQDNLVTTPPTQSCDILLNTIADADTEHESLKSLVAHLEKNPHSHIINHPAAVLKTTRDGNYERLNTIDGIRFPKTKRFGWQEQSPETIANEIEAAGFTYPFIVRRTGTHTAVSTALVQNREALTSYLAQSEPSELYAIEFVENKSAEGHYTKMRFFAIDGQLYPVVRHIDQVWNVHGGNRKTFMAGHDSMLAEEKQFMENPASIIGDHAYGLLQSLPDLIGLEFFGFDFTLLEDGTVLIFELNPAMRHSFDHADTFDYLEPHMQAIGDAFTAMVDRKIAAAQT